MAEEGSSQTAAAAFGPPESSTVLFTSTALQGAVVLFNYEQGLVTRTFNMGGSPVTALATSGDGSLIAAAASNGVMSLLRFASGACTELAGGCQSFQLHCHAQAKYSHCLPTPRRTQGRCAGHALLQQQQQAVCCRWEFNHVLEDWSECKQGLQLSSTDVQILHFKWQIVNLRSSHDCPTIACNTLSHDT